MSNEEASDNFEYDEEDDDNLEERPVSGKRKGKKLRDQTHKKRKSGKNAEKKGAKNLYFESGAEESDNGEEDSDLDLEQRQLNREKDEALYRTRKAPQFQDVVRSMEQGNIEERYNNMRDYDEDEEDEDDEYNDNMPDSLKKHKIKARSDQKIFSIPTRKNKEREVVIQLLNKFAMLSADKPYQNIYSISYLQQVESTIYIEGCSKTDVKNFIGNYHDVNATKIELISTEDFLNLYQDKEQEKFNVEKGMFVKVSPRCRNSDYINDMGQIYTVKNHNKVVVQLIPRINIVDMKKKAQQGRRKGKDEQLEGEGADEEEHKNSENKFNKKNYPVYKSIKEIEDTRPEQQFFSKVEYEDTFRENYAYKLVSELFEPEGEHCGYVYKTFNCKDLILNYQPSTLEELKKFFPHIETETIIFENQKFLKKSNAQTNFFIGDSVMINGGQVKGLKGKIVSLTNDTAKIVIRGKKKETFEEEVETKYLVKYFEDGQRVKIIAGSSEGITGTVLSTTGDICSVFTDNRNTIEVRSKDLAVTGKLGQETEQGHQTETMDKNQLKKKDLVKLSGFNSVGLVLDISKDFVKILDQSGRVKNISNFSINSKIDSSKFSSLNLEGNAITNNSNVLVKNGQYQGYQCQVVHVYKSLVFLFNPKFRDTYVVENINNVSLQTTNPVILRQTAKIAYDMKYGKQENLRADDMRQYVGRQMKIIAGRYKGCQCTVIDVRKNDMIKVEIHSKFISVDIHKTDLIASDKPAELEYGKTPSYVTQSTYQPNLSSRDHNMPSPSFR